MDPVILIVVISLVVIIPLYLTVGRMLGAAWREYRQDRSVIDTRRRFAQIVDGLELDVDEP